MNAVQDAGILRLDVRGRRGGRIVVVAHAVVADDTFARTVLAAYAWRMNPGGYVIGRERRPRGGDDGRGAAPQLCRLHTLVFRHYHGTIPPGFEVDHADRDKLNNRPDNLRAVTPSENCGNRGRMRTNTSGWHGVTRHRCGKWQAQVTASGHTHYLGLFDSTRDAADAVNRAYAKHFPHCPPPNSPT